MAFLEVPTMGVFIWPEPFYTWIRAKKIPNESFNFVIEQKKHVFLWPPRVQITIENILRVLEQNLHRNKRHLSLKLGLKYPFLNGLEHKEAPSLRPNESFNFVIEQKTYFSLTTALQITT